MYENYGRVVHARTRTHSVPRGTKSIITMSEQDQELAAFEAEMAKLAGEAPPTACRQNEVRM